ncbi:MAG: hypothetical protein M1833_000369 [Piccolia ochrophora]|nr:MAG: hypothetical protein M1833_000369 [Piccolia ochrophora]
MHSTLVRAQNVFGFFTTVAFTVALFTSLSVLFFPQSPSANVSLRNIQVVKGRPHAYASKREEYAHIKFDLDADLSSLFTWNTKQLFVYLTATYPASSSSAASTSTSTSSANDPATTAVIWDVIIPAPSTPFSALFKSVSLTASRKKKQQKKVKQPSKPSLDAHPANLTLRNVRPKYPLSDASGVLGGRGNATLRLGWNVQPWVGALLWTAGPGEAGDWGRWGGLRGGVSEGFAFPEVKVKKKEGETAGRA